MLKLGNMMRHLVSSELEMDVYTMGYVTNKIHTTAALFLSSVGEGWLDAGTDKCPPASS
jgi:hypothetical protein